MNPFWIFAHPLFRVVLAVFFLLRPETVGALNGPVGRWQDYNAGSAMGIAGSGNYAYVASLNGLFVYDFSNPSEPRRITKLPLPRSAYDVSIVGDRAYVACSAAGLVIVDISLPTEPKILGVAATEGEIWDVSVSGNYAYLASTGHGLEVVDISNEASPIVVSGFESGGSAGAVRVAGDIVYLGDGANSLKIFSVTNPLAPVLLTNYTRIGWADDIVLDGNLAYVADSRDRVVELDVTNPAQPVRRRTSFTPTQPKSLLLAGGELFVSATGGFSILGIRTGEIEIPARGWTSAQVHRDLAVVNGHVVLASDAGGLLVLNVTNHLGISLVAHERMSEDAARIVARGELALVSGGRVGLALLDVSDAREPRTLSRFGSEWDAGAAAFISDTSAIVSLSGVPQVLDFGDRTNFTWRATLPETRVTGIGVKGPLAVLGTRGTAPGGGTIYLLKLYDLANPAQPIAKGQVTVAASADYIHLQDTLAYVALGGTGFAIVDLTDPQAPVVLSTTRTPGICQKIMVKEGKAFVADYASGLQIYDVTNPALPKHVSEFADARYATGVAVSNTTVFIANGFSRELLEIDISDIASPKKVATFTHTGQPRDVIVHDDHVYAAHTIGGVSVYANGEMPGGLELTLTAENMGRLIRVRELTGRPLTQLELSRLVLARSTDLINWEEVAIVPTASEGGATFAIEETRPICYFRVRVI